LKWTHSKDGSVVGSATRPGSTTFHHSGFNSLERRHRPDADRATSRLMPPNAGNRKVRVRLLSERVRLG
jgi:hypothetical protein